MAECYPQGCPPCTEEIKFPENPINGQRECFHIGKDPNTGEDILKCWVYDQCVPGWRAEGPATAPIDFEGQVDLTKTEAENGITVKEAGDYYTVSVSSAAQEFLNDEWANLQHEVNRGAFILWTGTEWVEIPRPCGDSSQVQSDWLENDVNSSAFIKNKPLVGDGKIIIKQNNVEKGSFTVNQTAETTIDLDDESGSGTSVGTVIAFAADAAPAGFLKCNGAALSTETYKNLFDVIGTTYGDGGADTFRVPDLRASFVRGWDDGRSIDDGRAFGSEQNDQFKQHNHNTSAATYKNTMYEKPGASNIISTSQGNRPYRLRTVKAGGGNAGGTETRPLNIALLYCIKY